MQHLSKPSPGRRRFRIAHFGVPFLLALAISARSGAQSSSYDDHQNMMNQLGLKSLRPGPDPNHQDTFDEATANRCKDTLPDVLKMKDGARVTTPEQWTKRRAEIVEDFEREVYGRIPAEVPKVSWE